MKFGIAKNDNLFCSRCRANILYGEHYVAIFFSIKWGERKVRKSLIFHVNQCYLAWKEESFNNKYHYWEATLAEPKKRGRPKMYRDGKKVHRMKSLIYYHTKAGNNDKAQELQLKLSELRA